MNCRKLEPMGFHTMDCAGKTDGTRIERTVSGLIDDVVMYGCTAHLERLSDRLHALILTHPNGAHVHIEIRGRAVAVLFERAEGETK